MDGFLHNPSMPGGSPNKASAIAGNPGDVIKHASLVGVLSCFEEETQPILYLESNAFQPETELPRSPDEWREAVNRLPSCPALAAYKEIEKPYVERGRYLCSPGLAGRILGQDRENVTFVLFEKAAKSHWKLRSHFWGMGKRIEIGKDNQKLATVVSNQWKQKFGAVIGLVDPFEIEHVLKSLEEWTKAIAGAATKPDAPVAVLLFRSNRDDDWPRLDCLPWCGELCEGSKGYSVGLYANQAGFYAVRRPLRQLGWTLRWRGDK
jgi:23S rRNA A2030 N6-methylase RlmJ